MKCIIERYGTIVQTQIALFLPRTFNYVLIPEKVTLIEQKV